VDSSKFGLENFTFSFRLLDLREEVGQLFLYTVDKFKYVCRPLYISELNTLKSLIGIVPEYVMDEWILSKCLLLSTATEEYLNDLSPAGLMSELAGSILKLSRTGDIQEINKNLEEERLKIQTDQGIIESTMLAGTGNVLGKNYQRITAREQTRYLALAETIVGKKLEVQTVKEVKDSKGRQKRISPETSAMLSKEAADMPDIEADNKMFRAL